MWYFFSIYSIIFDFYNLFKLFLTKTNSKFVQIINNNIFFKKIIISCVITKLSLDFEIIFINCLEIFINLFHMLPITFKFYFKYRNKKYIEICFFKYFIFKNKKMFYRFIMECFIFLCLKLKKNIFLNNILLNLNLKYLNYYNKTFNYNNNFFINIHLIISPLFFYSTKLINNYILKFNYLFINLFYK